MTLDMAKSVIRPDTIDYFGKAPGRPRTQLSAEKTAQTQNKRAQREKEKSTRLKRLDC